VKCYDDTEDTMNLAMAYDEDLKVDALSGGRTRRAAEASADGLESDSPSTSEPRYERFEPITVRAAARVLQLQRAGVVTATEARFYLHELAAMDAHAGEGAFESLFRAARRCAATRPTAGRAPSPCSRRGSHPLGRLQPCGAGTRA
jgi:hypothetical protein